MLNAQFGDRETFPDNLAMNALEKLVPKDLGRCLLLNYSRFQTFDDMEKEVATYLEAKTGNKLVLSSNFAKASSSEVISMDVEPLVKALSGTLSSLVGKRKRQGGSPSKPARFDGKCDNCGKVGRKKKDCWAKGGVAAGRGKVGGAGSSSRSASASASPKKFDGKCDSCGKMGQKSKGKGKDAKSLEPQQLEQVLNKEANSWRQPE